MSGHSKWSQIKRKKEVADARRGQVFTRLATQIKQAARAGTDPALNPALAEAITQAKRANMPQVNIDRLLEASDQPTEEVVYEAFGPSGIALLITVQTTNSRRTVAEIRHILKQHGGTLTTRGSVIWKFSKQGQEYHPRYPQPLATADLKIQVRDTVTALDNHPDVSQVVTDAVE